MKIGTVELPLDGLLADGRPGASVLSPDLVRYREAVARQQPAWDIGSGSVGALSFDKAVPVMRNRTRTAASVRAYMVLETLLPRPGPVPLRLVGPQGGGRDHSQAPMGAGSVGGGGGGPAYMAQPDPAEVMRLAEQIAQTKFTSLKLEWEQFQRREEAKWTDRLRQKESTRMRELDDAFQNREKDRAAVVSRTQAEYVRLEAKLRKALAEVEARERRLAAAEEKLKQQHAQKLSELQLLQRRLREDSRHQVRRGPARGQRVGSGLVRVSAL